MNDIPAEIFKTDPETVLQALFKNIWDRESIPDDYKLPKKGDLKQCSNWRGICFSTISM